MQGFRDTNSLESVEASEFVKAIKIDDDGDSSMENLMHITETSNLKLGTAGRIYDTSMVLAKYLWRQVDEGEITMRGKNVLEFGCGTGSLAIYLASLGATVVASDLPIVESLVQKNIEANKALIRTASSSSSQQGGSVRFVAIDWSCNEEELFESLRRDVNLQKIDYILASDVYFNNKTFDFFSATLKSTMNHYAKQSEQGKMQVFISYKLRFNKDINEDPITRVFSVYGFDAERVHVSSLHEQYRAKDVQIFRMDVE